MLLDSKSNALVLGGFVLYAAALVVYWPDVLVVSDESFYVRQARAFADGSALVPVKDPWTGREQQLLPSAYPPGTSAFQAIFVRVGGWRAAVLAQVVDQLFTNMDRLTIWNVRSCDIR